MSLSANIADLKNQILQKLALNRQVVLLCILRPKILGELSKEQNGPIQRPINGLASRWIQNATGRLRKDLAGLIFKRRVEKRVVDIVADTERRLGAELLEDKLFDR